jgi:hypothetical protein
MKKEMPMQFIPLSSNCSRFSSTQHEKVAKLTKDSSLGEFIVEVQETIVT